MTLKPSDTPAADQTLHLLLIHQAFTTPGEAGGTRHYELSQRVLEHGHRVTVVASDTSYLTGKLVQGSSTLLSEHNIGGIRVFRAYTYPAFHRSYVWRMVSFVSFMATSLIAAMKAGRVDVVMGTSPPIFQAFSAWVVAALRRRPFLLEIRDLWPEFAIDIGLLKNRTLIWLSRRLENFLYHRADQLLVNSPAYREYLIGKGMPPEKITLVPNGVDPGMFDPTARGEDVRQQFALGERFVITYAGALGMANDIDTLVRAADRLRDDERIHVLLVGDGKERKRLERLVAEIDLKNLTFAGPQPKERMRKFLAASDACVAALADIRTFRTTYPNKVFDYMAAGRPTILAIDGVIRDVMEAAKGGICVEPGDARGISDAAKLLSENPELARTMGASARQYVVEHFDRQRQGDAFVALVEHMAAKRNPVTRRES